MSGLSNEMCAGPDRIRLPYPGPKFVIHLRADPHAKVMHIEALCIGRTPHDSWIRHFPFEIQVAVEILGLWLNPGKAATGTFEGDGGFADGITHRATCFDYRDKLAYSSRTCSDFPMRWRSIVHVSVSMTPLSDTRITLVHPVRHHPYHQSLLRFESSRPQKYLSLSTPIPVWAPKGPTPTDLRNGAGHKQCNLAGCLGM